MERRGKFFRSIKIFHNSPILCASGDHVAGEVANAALEAITRRTTSRRKNWTIVENFYRSKKFSTPFHVVTRCAQNWTFWTDRPLCLQLTYIYFWTIWNLEPNFPQLSKIYITFCGTPTLIIAHMVNNSTFTKNTRYVTFVAIKLQKIISFRR